MTVSYSIQGEKKTPQEIGKIPLMSETIIATCNNVRRRYKERAVS